MKICIIGNRLDIGGFTSSLQPMLKHLSSKGVKVDVMLFQRSDFLLETNENISVIYNEQPMNSFYKWRRFLSSPLFMLTYLRHFIFPKNKRYTVEFSQCESYLNSLQYSMLDLRQYDGVIAWEECFVGYYLANSVKAKLKLGYIHPDYEKALYSKRIDEIAYKGLDYLVAISNSTKEILQRNLTGFGGEIVALPNTLDVDKILLMSQEEPCMYDKSYFNMVSVARLDNTSKALDRLVAISARLRDAHHNFRWYIVGDGKDRAMTQKLIKDKGVQEQVIMVGAKTNPYPYIKHADLFVLQSYYEGRPLSVEEALILETPVLVSNYCSAEEQVKEGQTGFIAQNDEQAIFEKLEMILTKQEMLEDVRGNLERLDKTAYKDVDRLLEIIEKGKV